MSSSNDGVDCARSVPTLDVVQVELCNRLAVVQVCVANELSAPISTSPLGTLTSHHQVCLDPLGKISYLIGPSGESMAGER